MISVVLKAARPGVLLFMPLLIAGCVTTAGLDPGAAPLSDDVRIALVDWARWAQNAHNIQPWRVELDPVRADRFELYVDTDRLLPETDPPARQITISLGNFLAVVEARAAQLGLQAEINLLPDGEFDLADIGDVSVAEITLVAGTHPDTELSAAAAPDAITRPTVKYHYRRAALDDEFVRRIEGYSTEGVTVAVVSDPAEVDWLNKLSVEAFALEMSTEATLMETYDATRMTRRQRQEDPYGLSFPGNFGPMMLRIVEISSALFPQSPEVFGRTGTGIFTKSMEEIGIYVLVTTADNSRQTQLETGMRLQALWMELQSAGYVALPNSQALQEYPEMTPLYERIHGRYASTGETIQMLLAVAEPRSWRRRHSPRLEVEDIVVTR